MEDDRPPRLAWDTVLDIDALAKAEGIGLVLEGRDRRLEPEERYCLVRLSDGGKDAVTLREFDVQTKSFVDLGGSVRPQSEAECVRLIDQNTLLVAAADWGPGTTTKSGYAFVILKTLKRGQLLDPPRSEVYRSRADRMEIQVRVCAIPLAIATPDWSIVRGQLL